MEIRILPLTEPLNRLYEVRLGCHNVSYKQIHIDTLSRGKIAEASKNSCDYFEERRHFYCLPFFVLISLHIDCACLGLCRSLYRRTQTNKSRHAKYANTNTELFPCKLSHSSIHFLSHLWNAHIMQFYEQRHHMGALIWTNQRHSLHNVLHLEGCVCVWGGVSALACVWFMMCVSVFVAKCTCLHQDVSARVCIRLCVCIPCIHPFHWKWDVVVLPVGSTDNTAAPWGRATQ